MKEKKPQKQLLQIVMLALLSVVSLLVMADESYAALDCTACHGTKGVSLRPLDTTPATAPSSYRNVTTGAFKGNHSTHLGANPAAADCAICHNNSGYTSNHRDGGINMAANINSSPKAGGAVYGTKGVFFNQTSVPTLQTCSSVNCHFEAITPAWGSDPAATNCDSCHSSVPTSASHTKHTAQYGGTASCVKCHAARTTFQHATSAGNAGRKIDLTQMTGSYSGTADKYLPSQTPVYGSCATNYCHSAGQSFNGATATPYTYAAPVWNNPASGNCSTCHPANLINTGSHGKHVALNSDCGLCHTGASLATMASPAHVDGFINVSGSLNVRYAQGRSSARGNGYATCSNASCHSSTTAAALVTPAWGTAATCSSCHTAVPVTGAHTKHIAMSGVSCESCHTGAGTGTAGGAGHFNDLVDVSLYPAPGNVAKHAAGVYTATCSTACHSTSTAAVTTPAWGATTNCSSCHAAVPTTGAHTKHLAASGVTCGSCHTGATGTNGGSGHGNSLLDVTQYPAPGNVAKHAAGVYSATCSTACHSTTTTAIATPAWGVTATCNSCHASVPTTGTHTKHLAHTNVSCAGCHTNPGATGHVNNTIDVSVGGYPVGKGKGTPLSSCSNVSCHNGPASNPFTASAVTWGATLDCAGCHGYPPVNTNHNGVGAGTCNSCHNNVVAGGTQSSSSFVNTQLHGNGTVEGGRCDSCHGYPPVQSMAGLGVNANYSSAKLQNYSGGGGVHSVAGHLALTAKYVAGAENYTPCLTCHPQGATHAQGGSTFLTANVQVVVDPQFKFDKNRPIVYNSKQSGTGKTSGTCANVSCHFQKSPIWSTQTYTQGH